MPTHCLLSFCRYTNYKVKASSANFERVNSVLDDFYLASGLKVNNDKSVLLALTGYDNAWIENRNVKRYKIILDDQPIQYLGVLIGRNDAACSRVMAQDLEYKTCNAILNIFQPAWTVAGRCSQLKTLVSSQFTYVFSNALIRLGELNDINSSMLDFLWDYGPHRLNMDKIQNDYNSGGYNYMHLRVQHDALKLKWLVTFVNKQNSSNKFWIRILKEALVAPIEYILRCNMKKAYYHFIFDSNRTFWIPPFIRRVFDLWFSLYYMDKYASPQNVENMLNSAIYPNHVVSVPCPFPYVSELSDVLRSLYEADLFRLGYFLTLTEGEWAKILESNRHFYDDMMYLMTQVPKEWLVIINDSPIDYYEDNHIINLFKKFKVAYFRALLKPLVTLDRLQDNWENTNRS